MTWSTKGPTKESRKRQGAKRFRSHSSVGRNGFEPVTSCVSYRPRLATIHGFCNVNAASGLCRCCRWTHLLQSGCAIGEMTARLREAWLEPVERETS
jgi:hypothetical protein